MEPGGLLPCSHEPATCLCPEPNQSSPCLLSDVLQIHFNIFLPSMPVSSKWCLSLRFPLQYPACTSLAPRISFFLIWLSKSYSVRNTDHKAPRSVFPPASYLVAVRPNYFPQHPILEHPQPKFLLQCERRTFTLVQNNRKNYIYVYFNLYIFG